MCWFYIAGEYFLHTEGSSFNNRNSGGVRFLCMYEIASSVERGYILKVNISFSYR